MSDLLAMRLGLLAAIVVAAAAAGIGFYGRYRVLPSFLTGPHVCRLEAGGCQVLFRTREASLVGVPNAALGLILYGVLAVGLLLDWPTLWLLSGSTLGLAMSAYLAWYLLTKKLECRVCWTGHSANLVLWSLLLARFVSESTR